MTFSLTENPFSGKTYFYTIRPWRRADAAVLAGDRAAGVFGALACNVRVLIRNTGMD